MAVVLAASAAGPGAAQESLPPAKVTVQATGSAVTVAWAPVASKGISYRILRSPSAKERGRDLTTPITLASFVDAKVEPGMTYFYQVVAVYRDGTSAAAEPVGFTVPVGLATTTMLAPVPLTIGVMLPLQEPPAAPSGTLTAEPTLVPLPPAVWLTTFCNPIQTLPGPAPASFTGLGWKTPPMFGVKWPAVPGAVAYVVERAVQGTNVVWTRVGSTCESPSQFRDVSGGGAATMAFKDQSGSIVSGTKYFYKVKAIGAAGETGWNYTSWTAPGPPPQPQISIPNVSGSTVSLSWTQPSSWGVGYPYWRPPDHYRISTTYGWSVTKAQVCGSTCFLTLLGVPEGTHGVRVTGEWLDDWSPPPYRVYATSWNGRSITIQP